MEAEAAATTLARDGARRRSRAASPSRYLLPLAGWAALIAIGWAWGSRLNELDRAILLDAPPLFGEWDLRLGPAVLPAIAVAAAAVGFGPRLAARLSFGHLLLATAGLAALWALALALTDGADGIFGPLTEKPEYLGGVAFVSSPGEFLSTFTERIDAFPTHVRSHPPGFVLGLWGLERIGLGGSGPASILVVAVAASAPVAALTALRALGDEAAARRAAPFLALAPAAIWVATSADALYMGVGAWAVAATVLALVATGPRSHALALLGGLLFGLTLFLSYGLALLAAIPAGVAIERRRGGPLLIAAAGAAAVIVAFLAAGFWWLDGFFAIRDQYLASVAASRPYGYFVVNNLAAFAIAAGPALAVALALRRSRPAWLLVGGGLIGVLAADLSGMSKAEVERIWLPFLPWVLLAAAALPRRAVAPLLAGGAAVAVAVQVGVRTPW